MTTTDKKKFWAKAETPKAPLVNEMVAFAEKELSVKLPKLLIELLSIQNGGYTKGFVFPMAHKTSWADDHVPFESLFGIGTDTGVMSGGNLNILDTAYLIQEWSLPENQVLLTGEGHWWITLDYRNKVLPEIRWIDVECEEDVFVAESFAHFINGLVAEDQFLKNE